MGEVAQSLAPIIALIVLGAALLRFGFFADAFRRGLDRFVYWIALPSLFVAELSAADIDGGEAGWVSLVVILATLASLVIAAFLAAALHLDRLSRGAFIQASFRGNLIFVGLPVLLFSLDGPAAEAVKTTAVLAAAPIMLLFNIAGVTVLLVGRDNLGWKTLPKLIKPLVTNPLIIACLVGVGISSLPWDMPRWLHRSLDLVGDTSPALALISMGAGLVALQVRGEAGHAFVSAMIKVLCTPLAAAALIWLVGLEGPQARVALIFAATPSAVASYVLAAQLGANERLAAAAVIVSTLLSFAPLAVILYLT